MASPFTAFQNLQAVCAEKPKGKKSEDDSYITLQPKQTAVFPVTQPALFSSSHHYLHPRGGLGGGEKRFLLQVGRSAETASAFLISRWEYPIRGTERCQRDSCPTQGSLAHQHVPGLPKTTEGLICFLTPARFSVPTRKQTVFAHRAFSSEEQRFESYKLFWVAVLTGCFLHLCNSTKPRKVWGFKYQRHLTCNLLSGSFLT